MSYYSPSVTASTRVDCGSASYLDDLFDGGGTFMAWSYAMGWGNGGFGRIADKSNGVSDGWIVFVHQTGSGVSQCLRFVFFWNFIAPVTADWVSPNSSIVLNQWNNIIVSYDDDSAFNNPLMWINGQPVSVTQLTGPAGFPVTGNAQDLKIGNNDTNRAFYGNIADVRLYDGIWTDAKADTIWRCRGTDGIVENLVARWPLLEGPEGVSCTTHTFKDVRNNIANGVVVPSGQTPQFGQSLIRRRRVA